MAVTQRRARWLLPILVALGVAYMHTLGHSFDDKHHHGAHDVAAMTQVDEVLSQPNLAATRSSFVAALGDPPARPGSGIPMNPVSVCVAILAAALVLLVVALASVADGRLTFFRNRVGAVLATAGRGPPQRLGLRLAHLSVQRT